MKGNSNVAFLVIIQNVRNLPNYIIYTFLQIPFKHF